MRKAVLVVCDGLGDLPDSKGRTPLSAAKKPHLDRLAEEGTCGLMYTIGRGITPGSDTAHLAIFGYAPKTFYVGRGPFEALGMGIRLEKGDVAFRCNFSTVKKMTKGLQVVDRRAGRIDDAGQLAKALDGMDLFGVKAIFRSSVEHRGVLVLRGNGLSHNVSDADPHAEGEIVSKVQPLDATQEAKFTAKILNEFTWRAYEILRKHPLNLKREKEKKLPANIALCRGAGTYEQAPSFAERYGLKAACIAGGALYKGVAKYVGMDIVDVKGATGRLDSDLMAKAKAAGEALKKYDFVFLHVKGCDSAGHDGDFDAKKKMVEKIDVMVGWLMKNCGDCYIAVTGDHSTSVARKAHVGDPVPFALWGPEVRSDDVKHFDEFSFAAGGLGQFIGLDVMPMLLNALGRGKKYGS